MKISEIVNENDLKNIKKKGVYKISYNDSNRIYIGSTTQSFYLRWIQHMWEFKNNCHKNKKLVNVVNKYGVKSLSFEIVEIIKEENKVLEREQYYIDLYDAYKVGLNCSPSAYNSQGCKRSEDTLIKNFYNVVSQYSKEGKHIKTYKSLKEAAKKTKTDYITLSNACNEKTRLANGYQWRKGDNKKDITPVKSKGETTIYQYNNEGVLIKKWNSLKEAADYFKRPRNSFSVAVSKGREIENYFWSKEKKEVITFKKIKNGKKEIENVCV